MDEVALPDLQITEPLGQLAFLNRMANARLVLTDLEAQRLPAASRRRRRSWVCPLTGLYIWLGLPGTRAAKTETIVPGVHADFDRSVS
jgi:hypothetical protein